MNFDLLRVWLILIAKILALVLGYLMLSELLGNFGVTKKTSRGEDVADILEVLAMFPAIFAVGLMAVGINLAPGPRVRLASGLVLGGTALSYGLALLRNVGESWFLISIAYLVIGLLLLVCSFFVSVNAKDKI